MASTQIILTQQRNATPIEGGVLDPRRKVSEGRAGSQDGVA